MAQSIRASYRACVVRIFRGLSLVLFPIIFVGTGLRKRVSSLFQSESDSSPHRYIAYRDGQIQSKQSSQSFKIITVGQNIYRNATIYFKFGIEIKTLHLQHNNYNNLSLAHSPIRIFRYSSIVLS